MSAHCLEFVFIHVRLLVPSAPVHFNQCYFLYISGQISVEPNLCQLVGSQEEGDTIPSVYDWVAFISDWKKIPRIEDFHHFSFNSTRPGIS